MMEYVKFNVGGAYFLTTRCTLENIPNSKLAAVINSEKHFDDILGAYYFDRRPDLFSIILQAHREGVLHCPTEACGNEVLAEMDYWEIPKTMIAQCCVSKMAAAQQERLIAETVNEDILGDFERTLKIVDASHGWRKRAAKLWIFFEFPVSSTKAKTWSLFTAAMTIASVLCLMLMNDLKMRVRDRPGNSKNHTDEVLKLMASEKWRRLWLDDIRPEILYLDLTVNVIILIDMIFRISVCPYKAKLFKSKTKLLDLIVITAYWISQIANIPQNLPRYLEIEPTDALRYVWLVCQITQLFRPLLMIRLANTFVGLRVLLMVIKRSMAELLTIILFLVMGMMVFACFIFVAELPVDGEFESPFQGCWWALITMSTVGYGDVHPHAWPGYVVGMCCAIVGVIITGLSIPILSSDFNTYYNHVRLTMSKIVERMSEIKEDKDTETKTIVSENGHLVGQTHL
ncbi:potassium voltage-gated channel protein egl-36-like [Lineus longissimus]|uniref:potassium voltage-gated channel protein egl-36-like n=1 Tax=Lineus longissimus TaxID=88925 RepID=UPI002B4DAF52